MALYNRVKVAIAAGGAGNLTLGAPIALFRGFGDASVPNGAVVSYVIEDATASAWEYGRGTYTAPSTFARTTVLATSAGTTTPINAGATAVLFIDALAEDFAAGLTVGAPISGGTAGRVLFNNGGTVGEAANLTYDGTDTTAAGVKLKGATSGNITLKSPGTAVSYTMTLPSAVATVNGQSLTSDTSGNLSWTTETADRIAFASSSRVLGRATAGAGAGEELTATQVLDWVGAVQGQLLYRSATGWTALAAGNAGQFLRTAGASQNPAWADLPAAAVTAFAINKAYQANDIVTNAGKLYSAKAAFTSGATFNAADWNEIGVLPIATFTTLGGVKAPPTNGKVIIGVAADGTLQQQTFTATRVPFADATGTLTDDAGMTYDAATDKLTLAGDALVNGVTVGKGAGTGANNVVLGRNAGSALAANSGNVIIGGAPGTAAMSETMIFSTGTGVERFRVDSAGDVGVGIAAPASFGAGITTVHLHGTTGAGFKLSGNTGDVGSAYQTAGGLFIQTQTAKPVVFATNNSERLKITKDGTFTLINAAAPPAAPLANAGQLFVEGGALKFMGGNGTVTVIAPA